MTQPDSIPVVPTPSQPDPAMIALAQLMRRVASGASNFYWVAALSVVNSVISMFGGGMYFVIGLAASLFVDGFFLGMSDAFPEAQLMIELVGLAISVVIAGVFALFGYFAVRGKRWAFLVGMTLYALDTLLMVVFQEWMGLGFHLFFLWGLYSGLQALNQIQKQVTPQRTADFPQDIGVS